MKKAYAGLVLAATLAFSQSFCVLAAGSIHGGSNGGSGDSDRNVITTSGSSSSSSSTSTSQGTSQGGSLESYGTNGVATGAAETAGLPETAKNVIGGLNAGQDIATTLAANGYAVPAEVAGSTAVSKTQARVNVNPNEAISDYDAAVAAAVQAGKTVFVLFYNNTTNQFSVIVPTVEANGSLTYKLPADGTVQYCCK